jgi:phospholipid transport system transporter-binding protein
VSSAALVEREGGLLILSGVLDHRAAPTVREQGGRLIRGLKQSDCVIDCAAVEKSTSVGLSLWLAWMRDASAQGKTIVIRGLPQDMREIASVSGLLEVLPLVE